MSYKINGSSASIGAVDVRWLLNLQGIDHNGMPVYSAYANIEMRFPQEARPDELYQWQNAVSSGSVNVTVPDRGTVRFH